MTEEYSIYRRFGNIEIAQDIASYLNEYQIETEFGDNIAPVDVTFSVGQNATDQIEIRLKPSDFEKADLLLEQRAENQFSELDPSYYLFSYNDDELYDILAKHDEWNLFDYKLAQKLLEDRGKKVDSQMLDALNRKRIEELAAPEKGQKSWISVGYLFALMGGFFGIVIGYMLWTQKKTLPNGAVVYSYKKNDRSHGMKIFFIGLTVILLLIIFQVTSFVSLFD